MATHSRSIFAWRIPGTEEPGGLLSMGSHRVGHDWSDLAAAAEGTGGWLSWALCGSFFLSTLEKMDTLSVETWVLALSALTQEKASTLMELAKVTLTPRTKIWVFLYRGALHWSYGLPQTLWYRGLNDQWILLLLYLLQVTFCTVCKSLPFLPLPLVLPLKE